MNEEVYLIFLSRLTITSSIIDKILRLRKELYKLNRVLKYVAETINYNLHYKRDEDLVIYSNSTYDDNRNNRKLIYDYVLLYNYEVYI